MSEDFVGSGKDAPLAAVRQGRTTRWRKLAAMSRAEFKERAAQALGHRWDTVRGRWGGVRTPAVGDRRSAGPANFFFAADNVPPLGRLVRRRLPDEAAALIDRADRICRHRFGLLGYEDLSFGPEIDWHRDPVNDRRAPMRPAHKVPLDDFDQVGDPKVIWELNRHQHLTVLARAHAITGNRAYADEIRRQLERWTHANPYPFGINWASALEVAFRSLSWLWVRYLLMGSDAVDHQVDKILVPGLALHGRHLERYLSTYSSPNTHLLGEAFGLFAIGALVPEISGANRWRDRGWQIVRNEASRQILADGMHFEKSTHYHVYALDFFLHARLLADRNGLEGVDDLDRSLLRQFEALACLSRTGIPVRFGDDDGGRVFDGRRNRIENLRDPLATGAALYGRTDFKAAGGDLSEESIWLLGAEGVRRFDELAGQQPCNRSEALPASHIYFMSAGDNRRVAVTAGSWGELSGGHGHADLLSVQLVDGERVLLDDAGTFVYAGPHARRNAFRASAAHNTLTVDGRSQAQPRGPFKWDRLPFAEVVTWITGSAFSLFVGRHSAYSSPECELTLTRWVLTLETSGLVVVRDVVEGSGAGRLDVHWHFGIDTTLRRGDGPASLLEVGREVALALVHPPQSGWSARPDRSWGAPVYGLRDERSVLRFSNPSGSPAELATVLQPVRGQRAEIGKLRRLGAPGGDESGVSAYTFEAGDIEHALFFAGPRGAWRCGDWHSDARFLYGRGDRRADRIDEVVTVEGTYAHYRGKEITADEPPVAAGGSTTFTEWRRPASPSGER